MLLSKKEQLQFQQIKTAVDEEGYEGMSWRHQRAVHANFKQQAVKS